MVMVQQVPQIDSHPTKEEEPIIHEVLDLQNQESLHPPTDLISFTEGTRRFTPTRDRTIYEKGLRHTRKAIRVAQRHYDIRSWKKTGIFYRASLKIP